MNDILTWNAIRVFSGRIFTGPHFLIIAVRASNNSRTRSLLPMKCASKLTLLHE